jgi:hypothetical protein
MATDVHTDHEYEVEKQLWRLLVANQQLILAMHEGNQELVLIWVNRLKEFQGQWRDNMDWYMQHPKWNQSTDDFYEDVTGVPIQIPAKRDGDAQS